MGLQLHSVWAEKCDAVPKLVQTLAPFDDKVGVLNSEVLAALDACNFDMCELEELHAGIHFCLNFSNAE